MNISRVQIISVITARLDIAKFPNTNILKY